MPKLSINLVTWNGANYLPLLFRSLRAQTYTDFEIVAIDNDSHDATAEILTKELATLGRPYRLHVNLENKGFVGGHNQALQASKSDYVLLLNQDIYLQPDCIEKLVALLEAESTAAAVAPRLMKWEWPDGFTDKVDSLGLKVFRNRRVVEIGAGERWVGGDLSVREVFGVSGALPVFRRVALQTVAFSDGTVFDESYHSYKEDVDLAWRLYSAGFRSFVVPEAVAYHDRSAAGGADLSDRAGIKNKQSQSFFIQYYSYKNHLATLYKNEYGQNFLLDFPWILWYELKKLVYFLVFNRRVLGAWKELWMVRKRMQKVRIKNKELRKIKWAQIRRWWG